MAASRRGRQASNRMLPGMLAASLALGLAIMVIAAWLLWHARQAAWRGATLACDNLALTIAEAVESGIVAQDRALRAAARALSAAAPASPDEAEQIAARRQAAMDDLAATPGLGPVALADAAGRIVASANPPGALDGSVANEAYFAVHRGRRDAGLAVSRPFRLGDGGVWHIALTRRLPRPDGGFGGIVIATLPLATLSALLEQFAAGQHGIVSLLAEDGTLLDRVPFDDRMLGRDVRSAPLASLAPVPRGEMAEPNRGSRLLIYRRVGGLPLVVTVALSEEDIFAEWRRQAAITGLVAMLLAAAPLAGGLASRRELRRRVAAESAASRHAADYRLLAENSGDIVLRLDRHGILRYVSPAVVELLGYEAARLLGQDWRMLAELTERAQLATAFDKLQAGEERATVLYRCRHRGGHMLWVEATLRLVRDPASDRDAAGGGARPDGAPNGTPNGTPSGAIANLRDVTWRKQAEDERAAAAGKLAVLAATDGLTGLANRRAFDEALPREWRRAQRGLTHLALLMLDADWFKSFNDRYGHQRGDAALCAISACIAETIKRPGDLGARYGGEEFAVILPAVGEAGAVTVADDIRARLARRAIPHEGTPTGLLTVSIGIAALIVRAEREPSDLVAAADAALYAAKHAGRDRVVATTLPTLAMT